MSTYVTVKALIQWIGVKSKYSYITRLQTTHIFEEHAGNIIIVNE